MTDTICIHHVVRSGGWIRGRGCVALLLACMVGCTSAFFGCASDPTRGYSTQSTFSNEISSVAVPIFTNDSYTREVEFELTDALVKEIESRTPYKVTSQARADTVLIGRIRSIELDQLSKSRQTRLAEEMIVAVTIDFEWKDLRSGRTLVSRQEYSGTGLFVPSKPSAEPIELGQFSAVQQLARDVVSEMRSNW